MLYFGLIDAKIRASYINLPVPLIKKLHTKKLSNFAKIQFLCLKYLINSFFVFCYLGKVTKNKKMSCPVYLLFTEQVYFLLVNKKNLSENWF